MPDDGLPYLADLCPTCQEPRPFRIEEDDDGFSSATCAICGLVVPYGGQDSPGTSPEPEDDDDAPTSDAMTITYDADGTRRGSVDDVERLLAEANGPLGSTVNGMRWDTDECAIVDLLDSHGIVMNDDGIAVLAAEQDDDDGYVVLWCDACKAYRWCSWLRPGAYEGDEADADWARVCESCASWCFEDDGPEPAYAQHAQCSDSKVGTLHTLPPDQGVPESVGTGWSSDTCHLVRLVPHITPLVAAKHLLWGPGAGPPDQWMTGRPASKEAS